MPRSPGNELKGISCDGLLRSLRPLDSGGGPSVMRKGRRLHNFASNDYLGLSVHPALTDAFIEGIKRYGAGAGSARLVCGSLPPHQALETVVAGAKGTEAALVFSSGFSTAVGCLPAIVGSGDTVVLDKLAHASLIDGARLSGATLRVFPHNDIEKLGRLLTALRSKDKESRILVVTESVFSMDGDLCPLAEMVRITEAHEALLWLDEAHAFGVLGPRGMGLAAELGLQDRIAFQMGTFSKAAGLSGGYVAASRDWIDLIINRARAFIYSTAPPPALAHACLASLELIRSEEGDGLRKKLHENLFIAGETVALPTPIVPIILGENESALAAAHQLEELGFLVPAIRFPTVPRGTARLRISHSAAHDPESVLLLKQALEAVMTS